MIPTVHWFPPTKRDEYAHWCWMLDALGAVYLTDRKWGMYVLTLLDMPPDLADLVVRPIRPIEYLEAA